MTGLFPEEDEGATYFSRADETELLGTYYPQGFFLDNADWSSVEHYFQAMKFEDPAYRERIRLAPSSKQARKLGRSKFKKIRSDWKKLKTTIMTRALYTRAKTHHTFAQFLLETQTERLVENSSYDYFWGCGRDRRGDNNYGKALMNVRSKLALELEELQ